MKRPIHNNADEWLEFLSEYLDHRTDSPNGLAFVAVQIAEAIDAAEKRGAVFGAVVRQPQLPGDRAHG